MSLKTRLTQIIREANGRTVSLNQIEAVCKQENFKLSNAERRLRHSESPDIFPVYNEKKTAIIGYRWNPRQEYRSPIISKNDICCYSYQVFKVHDRNCNTLQVKEKEVKQAILL